MPILRHTEVPIEAEILRELVGELADLRIEGALTHGEAVIEAQIPVDHILTVAVGIVLEIALSGGEE